MNCSRKYERAKIYEIYCRYRGSGWIVNNCNAVSASSVGYCIRLGSLLYNALSSIRIEGFNNALRVIRTKGSFIVFQLRNDIIAVAKGLILRSLETIDSEGPAIQSVPMVLVGSLLAVVIKIFPGSTILSTFLTARVPIDMAAIA
ncbi:MAG: hypothetical protein ACTS6G_00655 [Candidatus Hodgkinia cicadicola]